MSAALTSCGDIPRSAAPTQRLSPLLAPFCVGRAPPRPYHFSDYAKAPSGVDLIAAPTSCAKLGRSFSAGDYARAELREASREYAVRLAAVLLEQLA